MNANKQDAGGLPELPEPVGHVHSDYEYCAERPFKNDGWPVSVYEAHQVRAYGELCRAAPAGGDVNQWFVDTLSACGESVPLDAAPAGSGEVERLKKVIDHYERGLISTPYTRAIVDQVRAREMAYHLEVIRLNRVVARQSAKIKRQRALLRKLQQGAHTGKVVAHRLHTPGGKWQWIDGEPSLGTLDLWKSYGWTLEYAYAASQGQEGV